MTIIQTFTTFFPYKLEAWLKKLKFTTLNNKAKTSHMFWGFNFQFFRKLHCMKNATTCVEKNAKNFIISLVFHETFQFLDSLWKTLEPSRYLFDIYLINRFGWKIKISNLNKMEMMISGRDLNIYSFQEFSEFPKTLTIEFMGFNWTFCR